MLSKLVKYDIKSLIRVFIPIWIAAPIVAVMLSGALHLISVSDGPLMNLFSEYVGPILLGILTILFVAVIVGMMIMTLILVIRRFWNGLLKEEGYLAFTLPVEVWQLIVSKVIVAAIVNLISGLIAALSCLILFLGISKEIFYSMEYTFSVIWRSMTGELGAYTGVLIVLGILFLIVCTYGKDQPHRSFMHSLVAGFMLNCCVNIVYPDAGPYFAVAFLSHLALDLLNYKRVKIFWPLKKGYSLRFCSADGWVNRLLLWLGPIALAAELIFSAPAVRLVDRILSIF